jgi:hypothetical protein
MSRSRKCNRQQNLGASVNRRNDHHLAQQNYNNYYGAPSLSKEYKPTPATGTYLHYLDRNKDSGLLPKITQPAEEKRRNLYSRETPGKKEESHVTPTLGQSELRKVGEANRNQLARNKDSEGGQGYLKQMPEEKEVTVRTSKRELEEVFKPKTLGLVGLNNIGNTCFMYPAPYLGTRSSSAC